MTEATTTDEGANGAAGKSGANFDMMMSYSWADQSWVRPVADLLIQRAHLRVWIDHYELQGDIVESMRRAVESSSVVVSVITPAYIASRNATGELKYANTLEKTIVPVRCGPKAQLDKSDPGFMTAKLLYVELAQEDTHDTAAVEGFAWRLLRTVLGNLPRARREELEEFIKKEGTIPLGEVTTVQPPSSTAAKSRVEDNQATSYFVVYHDGKVSFSTCDTFEAAETEYNDSYLDGCAKLVGSSQGNLYLAYFLPDYDDVRTKVVEQYRKLCKGTFVGAVGRKSDSDNKEYMVLHHLGGVHKKDFKGVNAFGKAGNYYTGRVDKGCARVLMSRDGAVYKCYFLPYYDDVRAEVMAVASKSLGEVTTVQPLSSTAAKSRVEDNQATSYFVVYHDGKVSFSTCDTFEAAETEYNDSYLDGCAKLVGSSQGNLYLAYFLPDYDDVRTKVVEQYRKLCKGTFVGAVGRKSDSDNKEYMVLHHLGGVHKKDFKGVNAFGKAGNYYTGRVDKGCARVLMSRDGAVYKCYFLPYYDDVRAEVMAVASKSL
ncbi:hypothetical protein HK405_005206 [Cladochytrium tenue]|nr:hypothetical protein HK405_005206 [Cladochytrium tenue]